MSPEQILLGISGILVLGFAAQWLAWRLRLPSILLLLLFGFCAGNFLSDFGPDDLLGELLFPFVSLAVAVILFEGGLTLRFSELPHVGTTVLKLISLGVLVTFAIATLAARWLVGFDWELSLLIGSILTVTGPTVIGPLLRHIRPDRKVGSVLNWEGILVDPVGALLAVVVFQAIREGRLHDGWTMVVFGVLEAIGAGLLVGLPAAALMVVALKKHWIPDHLQNPFALTVVLLASVLANHLHHESGLVAVTLMGVALANQRWTPVRHIVEFKENLRVLLITTLFILLASRVQVEDLANLTVGSVGFVLVLILIARPLAVAVSTYRSDLSWKEKLFIAWMAPRGIVAAAVASIFALRLQQEMQIPQVGSLVPLVFLVIVGTVATYGLTAGPLARRLGLAQKNPQGALILGADPFSVALGKALGDEGVPVLVVDSNYRKIAAARMEGLQVWHGNILAEYAVEEMRLAGIGRLLAMTPNDEANSLAALHLLEVFSRRDVFQLSPTARESQREGRVPHGLSGRILFGEDCTHRVLNERVENGWKIRSTPLTDQFGFEQFLEQHGGEAIPLFRISSARTVTPFTAEGDLSPGIGDTVISLMPQKATIPEPDVTG